MIRANARLLRDGVTIKIKGDSSRRRTRLGGGAWSEWRNQPSREAERFNRANAIHGRQNDLRKLKRGVGDLADGAVAHIVIAMLVGAICLMKGRRNQNTGDE